MSPPYEQLILRHRTMIQGPPPTSRELIEDDLAILQGWRAHAAAIGLGDASPNARALVALFNEMVLEAQQALRRLDEEVKP